jgi:hypothetical protein
MIMKKLIAIAVVFTLAVGGVFAADLGATVFGGVRLLQGDTSEKADDADSIFGAGSLTRLRLEGSGENDDGTFGAWLRYDSQGGNYDGGTQGLAWWKPIDAFKLTIGGNADGIYGKEGYSGWMFYQMPSDIDIVCPHSVWGGPYLDPSWGGYAKYRNAFFGGFGGYGLMLDITPVDMFGVHLVLPYIDESGQPLKNIFKKIKAQIDLNLDFGNIALTYDGNLGEAYFIPADPEDEESEDSVGGLDSGSKLHLFFQLTAIENLDLAIGFGYTLPVTLEETFDFGGVKFTVKSKRQAPIAVGLAAKFDVNDSFGLKARLLAQFMGSSTAGEADAVSDPFVLGLDLLPYIGISDSMKVFIGLGLTMVSYPEIDMGPLGKVKPDSVIGWHFNPYLQVGAEWGPTFYAGIRVYSYGDKSVTYDDEGKAKEVGAPIRFEIPIGLQVSF